MRFFDIVVSGLAISALFPLFLIVAVLLRVTGEGEIFYHQSRIGLNGEEFKLLKFATMLKDSPNIGPGSITLKDDPRILPFGNFLRKSKINELPQLFNIILGDMSFIGPRPLTKDNLRYYDEKKRAVITSVKPGLSGLGSIIFRSEDELLKRPETAESFYKFMIAPYKSELEFWYVNNRSYRLDLALFIETILVVMFPKREKLKWLQGQIPPAPLELQKLLSNDPRK